MGSRRYRAPRIDPPAWVVAVDAGLGVVAADIGQQLYTPNGILKHDQRHIRRGRAHLLLRHRMDARHRHLVSFKAAFFTELLARAVARGAVHGTYRLITIDVAECPFETSAHKRTHRPRLEGGRRTINEQHG